MKPRECPLAAFAALCALLALSPPAVAQGKQADYERALSLRRTSEGKVLRANIRPNWLPDGARFWYRVDGLEGRRDFILVDPRKSAKSPAFDPVRLAAALSKITGKPVAADKLPVERIAFPSEGKMVVQVGVAAHLCDLATYELTESADSLGRIPALYPELVRRSRDNGEETAIAFANRTPGTVKLFWITSEGDRREYGTVDAGATRSLRTFAGHAWLTTSAAGEPLAAFVASASPSLAVIEGPVSRPAAIRERPRGTSPDGKWTVAFRESNIYLREGTDGTSTPLTTDGSPSNYYNGGPFWSPDSTHAVVFQSEPAQEHKVSMVESSPNDQTQPKLKTLDYLKPGDRIEHPRVRLLDVKTRRVLPIPDDLCPNPWDIGDVAWSENGKEFSFVYNERGHQRMRLIAVNAETGAARAIINEEAKTFICYSSKSYLYRLPKTREAIWMSERDGWCHLYLYDTTTGQVKNQITRGPWVVRDVERVDTEKRQIWFRAGGIRPEQDPYYIHYCRINFDGTGLTILTEGDGTHNVTYSPNGEFYTDTYSRVDLPPVVELRRTSDGKKVLDLEQADASALLKTGRTFPERFVAKGRDGTTDIYGVIWRPTNFDPKRKYPIIENIYAGPQGAFVPKGFALNYGQQELAELGFIVVQMDGMGTNWRSKAFHDVCWKNLGDAGFPDRILWIKAAAAKYPYMDINRVGIYGTSAGGQNSLGGMLYHPEFYKACVSDCGCHDNRMDKIWWNEQWMGWPIGPHYAEQSNVTLAPRLQGKLLLMVGELDTNVDPASTIQVTNALIRANKDYELLVYPGGGHGVLGTEYGRRRMWDFFVRNLLGTEPRS